jgi:hypothetical protein
VPANSGRYPSGQRGQTVNLLAYAFGGSNPPLPTICSDGACTDRDVGGLSEKRAAAVRVASARAIGTAERDIFCGNSSAVERQPSKLGVAGSNPVSRSNCREWRVLGSDRRWAGPRHAWLRTSSAHVAQLAERVLGKDEVSGSNPDMGSRIRTARIASIERR